MGEKTKGYTTGEQEIARAAFDAIRGRDMKMGRISVAWDARDSDPRNREDWCEMARVMSAIVLERCRRALTKGGA